MSKKYAKFLTALFCGFLAVLFTANALTPDKDRSENENRSLAQRPQVTAGTFKLPSFAALFTGDTAGTGDFFTGKLMEDYETYATDQFVLRDGWVAAKALSERLTGKQENNGVYFCDGSTLISRFDEPSEKRLTNNIDYVNQFAEKVTVPLYFGLIPTQATVWADKLPQGAPNYDQKQIIDLAAAQAPNAQAVDFYTPLMAHKGEEIFYRTDHHWTSLGAYYGYEALAKALGLEAVPLASYEKTTVSTEFYGTVFSTSGVRWVKPDQIDTYVPEEGITVESHTFDKSGSPVTEPRQLYDESYLAVKDKYSMFLGGQQPLGVVKTGNTDKPKLLLIRDSYSDSLVPFLTPHFSEIHLIDLRYYKQSAAEYIRDNGIDLAVVLYSVPNFSGDTNMAFLKR